MVVSKQPEGFDPDRMRKMLKKSGFSIPKVELQVRGVVEKWEDMLALRVHGLDEVLVLAGGEKIQELAVQSLAGSEVRIDGLLHPPHEDQPPGLTVESFALSDLEPQ